MISRGRSYVPEFVVLGSWLFLVSVLRAELQEKSWGNKRGKARGENFTVFVALDQQQLEQLADSSTKTNRHSLRALWAQNEDFWDITMVHDCPAPCSFTMDPQQQHAADAVLFSAQLFPAFGRFEQVRESMDPSQTSILWSTEAVPTFRMGPQIPILRGLVDVIASYELEADIPLVTFPSALDPSIFARQPMVRDRVCEGSVTRKPEIVWVASNCDTTFNRRTEYVAELMLHVPVHSYGRCLHNIDLPAGFESARTGHKFWTDKVKVLEAYTFALVFENSDASHYVTEKLFQALAAGAIPIYMGAKNIDEFLPSPSAVIRVWDFESPASLAVYLQSIVCNQTALASFHAWRARPLPPSFLSLWHLSWDTAKCRICQRLQDPAFEQPSERMQRTLRAAMDWQLLSERGCEAEDAGVYPLAQRYQRAAMRVAPEESHARQQIRAAMRRVASVQLIAVTVSLAGASHQVLVPVAAPAQQDRPGQRHVDVHTVMGAVDAHCLSHKIEFGPPCQELFMAVGMSLEASNVFVPHHTPYEGRAVQGEAESLCATLDRLHRGGFSSFSRTSALATGRANQG